MRPESRTPSHVDHDGTHGGVGIVTDTAAAVERRFVGDDDGRRRSTIDDRVVATRDSP